MPPKITSDLKPALRALYARQLRHPASWNDKSDHAYINNHLIERGIAGPARRLCGELVDTGGGRQPDGVCCGSCVLMFNCLWERNG